jgi:hypothetical protein
MILKKIFSVAILSSVAAYAGQPMPKELYDTLWGKISNSKNISFGELTQNGQFAGCELVFRYPLRDYRQFAGEPIVLTGSVTNNYWAGKAFSISLKVQPNKIEFNNATNNLELKTLTPQTASMVVGNVNLKKFERTKFECTDGGLCIGYGDKPNTFELITTIFEKQPFDGIVLYSMSKTGLDLKFKLSEMDSSPTSPERIQFTECMQKSLQGMLDFYKDEPKAKK